MIKILWRHNFLQVFGATVVLTLILVMGAWLTQSLRFVETMIEQDISILQYFSMIYLLLPSLTAIVLPICTLLATVYAFQKFLQDNELVVFQSCGLSPWQVASPIIFNGFLTFIICSFLTHYLAPKATDQFNVFRTEIARDFTISFIREGVFNKFKNTVLFVSAYDDNNQLKGIYLKETSGTSKAPLLSSSQNPSQKTEGNYVIFAQSGYLVSKPDKNILYLFNGCRQEINQVSQNVFYFEELKYDLDLHQESRNRRKEQHRLNFWEMINPSETLSHNARIKFFIEANKRLVNPLLILMFSLITCAISLLGTYQRRGRWKKPLLIVTVCLLLHITLFTLMNSYGKIPSAMALTYGIILSSMVGSYLALINPEKMMRLSFWIKRKLQRV